MDLKIKSEFAGKKVAFSGSEGKSLGELSPEGLVKLAIIAQDSKDRSLLNLFEGELPTLHDLKKPSVKKELEANKTLGNDNASK